MDFSKLAAYMDAQSTDVLPGADMVIYQNHKEVFRHYVGYRDREKGIPMDGKELYWIFSASKVFAVTAGMQLVEKGMIGLDAPLKNYMPEFSDMQVLENGNLRPAKNDITIRHLFTMRGGFSYELNSPQLAKALAETDGKADTLMMIKALAKEPLLFDPGTHYRYSLCHDVLAALVETVSGVRYSEYLRQNIFEPLGIKRTGFHGEDMSQFAQQYIYDEKQNKTFVHPAGNICIYRLSPNYDSGGAGIYSCVEDYILLSDALACGGVGKSGARILNAESIDLLRTPQLDAVCHKDFLNHMGPQYTYGLGVRTVFDQSRSKSPIGEFGWDGAACAYTLCDPTNRLSAFIGMHVRDFSYGYTTLHYTMRDLMYTGLNA